MDDDSVDIEERIREAKEERLRSDLREHDRRNRELLGQCLKQLRVYLMWLSKEARASWRFVERQEERDAMHREERRMRKEQYPCDEAGEMYYGQEFQFEWL